MLSSCSGDCEVHVFEISTAGADLAKERMWTFDADYVTRNSGSS